MGFTYDGISRAINKAQLARALTHWFRFDHLSPERGIAILIGIEPIDQNLKAISDYRQVDNPYKSDLVFEITFLNGEFIVLFPDGHAPYEERQSSIRKFGFLVHLHSTLMDYWKSGMHPEQTPMTYFLGWADRKDFVPKWLSVAEEIGLATVFASSNSDATAQRAADETGELSDESPQQRRQRISEYVDNTFATGRTKESAYAELAEIENCTVNNIKRIYKGHKKQGG